MIIIRQAVYEDIPRIMSFIDEHWKKGHIMGNDRTMFEFQHVREKEVFYIIAEDDEDAVIYGTMGYIPMNRTNHPDVFTMMIKTLKGTGHEFLSDEMVLFLRENLNVRYHIGVGIRKKYAKALEVLDEGHIVRWNQYYRLNDCAGYRICNIVEKRIPPVEHKEGYFLREIQNVEDFTSKLKQINLKEMRPYRDCEYITHRYFQHPVYVYQAYELLQGQAIRGILISRENAVNNAKCLRIVDYYGAVESLRYIGFLMDKLMKKKDYEYVDFCNYGIKENILIQAGFRVAGRDKNIVPDYFEPYEQKNIETYIYANDLKDVNIYKAFSDQDRPNRV